jgi:hypothetical protein
MLGRGSGVNLVYRLDGDGRRRTVRMVYEVATFQALCEQLRCKEIRAAGAGRWRDPDEDLPKDFEERRSGHYQSLRKPLDPAEFISDLRREMEEALAEPNAALPRLDWLEIAEPPAGAIRSWLALDSRAFLTSRELRGLSLMSLGSWPKEALQEVLVAYGSGESVRRQGCTHSFFHCVAYRTIVSGTERCYIHPMKASSC